jgi:hypothetical protein
LLRFAKGNAGISAAYYFRYSVAEIYKTPESHI